MKKLLILIIILCLIPFSQAFLTIEPQSVDIIVYQNTYNPIELTVKNNYNFSIYNVSFSELPYTSFPYIPLLVSNETKKINASITTNGVFSKRHNTSTIRFLYSSSVFIPPTIHNITITANGYIPQSIILKEKDSILWLNNDTLPHTITSNEWDYTINQNQSKSLQFNENKSIEYYDINIGFHGYITILEPSDEFLHNNDFDRLFSLDLASKYTETSITIELIESSFTIPVGSANEGLIKLKNVGNMTAIGINITSSSEWLSFRENNFSLLPSQTNYVNYLISPSNIVVNDTNKTHIIAIIAYGENFAPVSGTISVIIPYEEDMTTTNTTADWWEKKKAFCDAYPQSQLCVSSPVIKEVEKVIYKEQEYPINITGKEMLDINRRLTGLESITDKSSKFWTEKGDSIDTKLLSLEGITSMISSTANQSVVQTRLNEERTDAILMGFVLTLIFVLLLIAGGITMFLKYKLKKKELINQ